MNTTETTEKKTRVPRNADTIAEGLFKLPFEQKVAICKKLHDNINKEAADMQAAADKAANLLKS